MLAEDVAGYGGTGKGINKLIKVNVRWFDGYLEVFDCLEVRFGNALLWLKLENGNRHIPLNEVRWFSLSEESHEVK